MPLCQAIQYGLNMRRSDFIRRHFPERLQMVDMVSDRTEPTMPNARSFFHCLICVGRILKSHTPAGWIEPTPHSGFKFDRFRFGLTCGSSEKLFVLFLAVLHADIHLFAISAVLTLF